MTTLPRTYVRARIGHDPWTAHDNPTRLILAMRTAHRLRGVQHPPPGKWRSWGTISGRGWGKTLGLAVDLNSRVEHGTCTHPALMAPTVDRVRAVQVAAIVATSPPWCRAEPYSDGVRWANGVVALAFTPEAPGRSRSENLDYAWMTEIVDWLHTTRREAFDTLTTAVRTGVAQYVWDTTSKGKNDVIRFLLDQHEANPDDHRLIRGTMFENPFLGRDYLRDETRKYVRGSRRWLEEVLGEVFDENAGALWQQQWIDNNRVAIVPSNVVQTILGCDPALSDRPDADETGIIECALDSHGHVYVTRDETAHHSPEAWGDLIVERCLAGAAGVVIERNHIGDNARANIAARAKERGQRVVVIPHGARAPFPRRVPGTIVVREVVSRTSKGTRAHPVASMYESGRVHHVGVHSELELEMTTWEPDVRGPSPNRLDALCEAVNELAEVLVDKPAPRAGEICAAAAAQRNLVSRVQSRTHGVGRSRLGL